MKFTKMQGLGNDYLYVYSKSEPNDPGELSKKLSDRHFGAGSDGMIWILPSDVADFKMRIFNADGSEAKMCGNGIRCVGKYVYDKGFTTKTTLKIETLSGIKTLGLEVNNKKVLNVSVNMGTVQVYSPFSIETSQKTLEVVPVSVGNPHAVIFTKNAETVPVEALGSEIEHNKLFSGGVNVEFVEIIAKNKLRMRVWERGSGITLACGTGACASVAAAVNAGFCSENCVIEVVLDGGILKIELLPDKSVIMTGPAEFVYEGEC